MSEAEESRRSETPERAWLLQENEEDRKMQITITPDELCSMVRAREKLEKRLTWGIVGVTTVLAAGLLYNVYRIDQPWIRIGQAWILGVVVYLFAPAIERQRRYMGSGEPCARFLERQHEERRFGYLRIRSRLFLLIPGMIACWWGRSALLAVGASNLEKSNWLSRFFSGQWLFVMAGIALVLVWLAFGKAAEKAACELEQVRGSAREYASQIPTT
jgi:hypothetical protein